ncbi:hypothetical protein A3D11_02630 [Candidatus Peribacteria bacterium RIFCSPHIGHO2_02_FULL_49_16]|nr:MAG: hypothetical protein A2880_01930 [Candidatus Peribacteria bacterium RIFCSPHIGHO2_01_FULL_49_38]OGJ58491.1 MAG: hypothetical protein A3D11_02630 [Candidatus Peribacteria bacterium RIFCSPHIGHO2_02_FULL_49_16]
MKNPLMLETKVQKKIELQSGLGWPIEPRLPLLCIPTELTEDKGASLFQSVLPGLLSLPLQILVRGCGRESYGNYISKVQKEYEHKIAIIPNTEEALQNMHAAADMALFCSDPDGLPELSACLKAGIVPITSETQALDDYNPLQESGTAFFFTEKTPWHCFAAITRATETYRFPFDWKTIQKECMRNTWQN